MLKIEFVSFKNWSPPIKKRLHNYATVDTVNLDLSLALAIGVLPRNFFLGGGEGGTMWPLRPQ